MLTAIVLALAAGLLGAAIVVPRRASLLVRRRGAERAPLGGSSPLCPAPGPARVVTELPEHAGRSGGFRLAIDAESQEPSIAVHGDEHIPPSLALRHRERARGGLLTGDPAFDGRIELDGDELVVRALMDAETRALVQKRLVGSPVIVRNGIIRHPGAVPDDSRVLERICGGLLELAERLALREPDSVPERLLAIARSDPQRDVRDNCLRLLLNQLPDAPETEEAARLALEADDPEVKLIGVRTCQAAGYDAAVELVTERRVPELLRLVAAQHLAATFEPSRVVEPLRRALEDPTCFNVHVSLVDLLAKIEHPGALAALTARLADPEDTLVPSVLEALESRADPGAEEAVLPMLEAEDAGVRAAAARALGAFASVAAVEPLSAAAEGLFTSREVKTAVREAIAAIQGRAGGAQSGQLSVLPADEEAGAVSLIQTSGAVSVTEPEPTPESPLVSE